MWGTWGIFLCLNSSVIMVLIILKRIRGNGFDNIESLTLLCCPTIPGPGFMIFWRMKDGGSEGETV